MDGVSAEQLESIPLCNQIRRITTNQLELEGLVVQRQKVFGEFYAYAWA